MDSKNFIPRNDGFSCESCGFEVGPAKGTFRNHCPACLTSKHVDHQVPGDRLAACQGLMTVTAVEGTDPDTLDLVQQCQRCGKIARNRTASDDDKEKILALISVRS